MPAAVPSPIVEAVALALALCGCSSTPLDSNAQTAGGGNDAGANNQGGAGSGLGGASSTPVSAASLVLLYNPPTNWSATALAFDPERVGELWVTLRRFPSNAACNNDPTQQTGCSALIGEVALVTQATSPMPSMALKRDGNAWHFMRRPTSIAFGENGNLATCGEARTDNYNDDPEDYSGPVLWSSDPAIFGAIPKADQNGTHIDMLHETPFCMGIAHDFDNAYFAFNGQLGAIDRSDFKAPHVVGGDDHSDGEVRRFIEGELLRVPEVPSHLALDRALRKLYIADTGHQRIVRLAVDTGSAGADIPALDPIAVHVQMDGAVLEEWVPPGVLRLPSGVALAGDNLLVTDNATSKLWWFDSAGHALGSLDTGLPEGSLSGVSLGPDGKIYLSDLRTGGAYRVESL